MPGPRRQSPRLRGFDYASRGAYFVTCVQDGACLLGAVVADQMLLNQLGRIAAECWRAIPVHFGVIELDEFIVMPNHIHGIVCSTGEGHAPPLHLVIGSFKSATSRLAGRRLWQRSYYDRVIRNETELHELRKYIGENPLRWALRPAS
jgi:putative transposase